MDNLEEIKLAIKNYPIVDIVGKYISLNKKGANYEGICPFHQDTRPSLMVNNSKGLFKCFACETGGDAISFVSLYKKTSFLETIDEIAKSIGLDFDLHKLNSKESKNPKFETAFKILTWANSTYLKEARSNHKDIFLDFLKNRKISNEVADLFQIGLCPPSSEFTKQLNNLDEAKKEKIIKASLELNIVKNGKNGLYDFFYNRITFPIHDEFSKVRGFSCRRINEQNNPKYLNSSESFIFHKENILYGLHIAKPYIYDKGFVILVEGNMDVIALNQYGFKNSVASMGTSLSLKNVQKLAKMTQNIYFAYDSDNAGKMAMKRSLPHFLQLNILPKYLNFAPFKDADEYLAENGQVKFQTLVDEAPPLHLQVLDELIPNEEISNTDKRIQIFDSGLEILSHMQDGLLASEIIINFAKKLKLKSSPDELIKHFNDFKNKKIKPNQFIPKENNNNNFSKGQFLPQQEVIIAKNDQPLIEKNLAKEKLVIPRFEKLFLKEIIAKPHCTTSEIFNQILNLLECNAIKDILNWVKKIYLESPKEEYIFLIQSMLENGEYSSTIKNTALSSLFSYDEQKVNKETMAKLLNDFGYKIKLDQLSLKKKALIIEQKNAFDDDEAIDYLKQIQEINKKIIDINQTKLF